MVKLLHCFSNNLAISERPSERQQFNNFCIAIFHFEFCAFKKMPAQTLTITNTTKGRLPRLPFQAVKEDIIGKPYSLSLAFVSDDESRVLNEKHRGKNTP